MPSNRLVSFLAASPLDESLMFILEMALPDSLTALNSAPFQKKGGRAHPVEQPAQTRSNRMDAALSHLAGDISLQIGPDAVLLCRGAELGAGSAGQDTPSSWLCKDYLFFTLFKLGHDGQCSYVYSHTTKCSTTRPPGGSSPPPARAGPASCASSRTTPCRRASSHGSSRST